MRFEKRMGVRLITTRWESCASRAAGRCNGFDALRLALALGILAFHSLLQQGIAALSPGLAWWTELALSLPLASLCAALLWHGVERPLLSCKHEFIARLSRKPVRVVA
jgi:peptidoglycan/LPS O-acetylase OafA/YrhL